MAGTFSVGLDELVAQLGGELVNDVSPGAPDHSRRIDRIGPFEGATASTITFAANPRLRNSIGSSLAGCVIVAPRLRDEAVKRGATIVTPDPYLYFAKLTQWWASRTREPALAGVHASAVIDPSVTLGLGVSIGPLVVIEAGASIGDGVVIGAHGFIGRDASIGTGTQLKARVTLAGGCHVGARCVLHSGVVIGADGFGFAPDHGRWEKIEQLGGVRIGDDVDIGANTCIDRGALDDTLIGRGVKLDNLIQIGHNVQIGEHTAIAGCVGIAGSAKIGSGCTIGGAAMIAGHLTIADGVNVSGGTVVSHSLRAPGTYTGVFPIDDNASWEKNAATLRQLHSLRERLRALERSLLDKKNDTNESPP